MSTLITNFRGSKKGDLLPNGASQPAVRPKGRDDVGPAVAEGEALPSDDDEVLGAAAPVDVLGDEDAEGLALFAVGRTGG